MRQTTHHASNSARTCKDIFSLKNKSVTFHGFVFLVYYSRYFFNVILFFPSTINRSSSNKVIRETHFGSLLREKCAFQSECLFQKKNYPNKCKQRVKQHHLLQYQQFPKQPLYLILLPLELQQQHLQLLLQIQQQTHRIPTHNNNKVNS